MRSVVITIVCVLLLTVAAAQAGPNRTVTGALIGAGAGLVLGNNADWVGQDVAVPVLAVAGGLIGHHLDRKDRHHERPRAQGVEPPSIAPQDLHPGVDLVKVSIVLVNGVRTDIPLLRLNEKFVGPQGEEYESLPTAKVLTARYGR